MISTAFEVNTPAFEFNRCATDSIMRTSARSVEKLSELNAQAFHAAFEEHSAIAAQARSPVEMVSLQAALLFAAPKKAMSYWRHVGQITLDAFSETMMDGERCLSESMPQARAFIDSMTAGAFAKAQQSFERPDAGSRPRIVLAGAPEVDDTGVSPIIQTGR